MDIQAIKKEIINEVENLNDEKMVWALAHFLHLDNDIPEWQKTELKGRIKDYYDNPSTVFTLNEIEEKYKKK
ncbi:MAG: hypothetical protein RL708_2487 [Bacteroidota bacterium]|jgi:hypothetical protein